MFMLVGGNRCPTCGVVGEEWRKTPLVFICPVCDTVFNEFGLLTQPYDKEVRDT